MATTRSGTIKVGPQEEAGKGYSTTPFSFTMRSVRGEFVSALQLVCFSSPLLFVSAVLCCLHCVFLQPVVVVCKCCGLLSPHLQKDVVSSRGSKKKDIRHCIHDLCVPQFVALRNRICSMGSALMAGFCVRPVALSLMLQSCVGQADFPSDKKQEAATALLRDAIHSLPIAARASKILGPISRHLMAQIIPMIWNAARASRTGLAVGILRVLYNGMCAAQRFHMDDEDPGEPDSLSHHNEFPLLYNLDIAASRNAAVRLRRDDLFHALLRSVQY